MNLSKWYVKKSIDDLAGIKSQIDTVLGIDLAKYGQLKEEEKYMALGLSLNKKYIANNIYSRTKREKNIQKVINYCFKKAGVK